MEPLPLLSVIVPVYKVEAYLDRCLTSITGQTYDNLEILLVDDGSPDGSGAICDAWAAKDSRVRVIHKENAGAGAARNTALDEAKGELIGFVDSDDYIAPNMYRTLWEGMDGETDIAECGWVSVTEDEAPFGEKEAPFRRYTPREAMAAHIQDTCFQQVIWNKLYRRETVGDTRFPLGVAIDDEFFTYRVLGKARSLVRTDRVCYAYRQQPGSVMHQGYSLKRLSGVRAKKERLSYLEQHMPELVPQAKHDLLMSCLYAMQGSLRSLSAEELSQAEAFLRETAAGLQPLPKEPDGTPRRTILTALAGCSLAGTAKLLNFLEDIHILK